jgi:hypothetical protein
MNTHKIDDIQRASIRRSEAYLRTKAGVKPTGYIREFITGVAFALLMMLMVLIGMAL